MIKRTLYFGNPVYLSLSNGQLVVSFLSDEKEGADVLSRKSRTIPVEDIWAVILDNRRISLSSGLMSELLRYNVSVVTCDEKSMPVGLLLPLDGHSLQSERFKAQLDASLPLRKQLWQQTVSRKIANQAAVLRKVTGKEAGNMLKWSGLVKSGDIDNMEGRAAAFYWKNVFPTIPGFVRGRFDEFPNSLLNYGYAILRAIVARALVASGMLPTIGIHHHNRYNAYCLADDIMEPYRPFVDSLVVDIMEEQGDCASLTKEIKTRLLGIPVLDVSIDGHTSPLIVAATTTTASLYKCYAGESRKLLYPVMT